MTRISFTYFTQRLTINKNDDSEQMTIKLVVLSPHIYILQKGCNCEDCKRKNGFDHLVKNEEKLQIPDENRADVNSHPFAN